jgi:hypothetical protein
VGAAEEEEECHRIGGQQKELKLQQRGDEAEGKSKEEEEEEVGQKREERVEVNDEHEQKALKFPHQ